MRTEVVIPSNVTHVVWTDSHTGYRQYTVKCGCTTSMGTACRRWAIGYRDGVTPVCQTHLSPNATPLLSPAAIERRRVTAANQRAIRHTSNVTNRLATMNETVANLMSMIGPGMSPNQISHINYRIVQLSRDIERIRAEADGAQYVPYSITVPPYAPTVPPYAPAPTEPLAEEKQMVEDECPICMEDYVVIRKAPCGHHACPDCCLQMNASGRTVKCPLCRDMGFNRLVSYAVPTPAPVMT